MAPKTELGNITADIMIDILESYMEYVAAVEYALNFADMPYQMEERLLKMTKQRQKDWKPILEKLRKDKENDERC